MIDPEERFQLTWIDFRREPKEQPDPNFPTGRDIDVSGGAKRRCSVVLPCPAQRCGLWTVTCRECGVTVAATTAGRPDDPRRLIFACKD